MRHATSLFRPQNLYFILTFLELPLEILTKSQISAPPPPIPSIKSAPQTICGYQNYATQKKITRTHSQKNAATASARVRPIYSLPTNFSVWLAMCVSTAYHLVLWSDDDLCLDICVFLFLSHLQEVSVAPQYRVMMCCRRHIDENAPCDDVDKIDDDGLWCWMEWNAHLSAPKHTLLTYTLCQHLYICFCVCWHDFFLVK